MDALRAIGNLAVMALVSLVSATVWSIYHPGTPEVPSTPFGTVWFVAFLCVWGLVHLMSGGGRRSRH